MYSIILTSVPFSLCLLCFTVLMWTMERHQVAAHWTLWPVRARASFCRPTLSTANGESRFSTAPTATTTSHLSLCPETPPLPVICECIMSFASTFINWILLCWKLLILLSICLCEFVPQLNLRLFSYSCHSDHYGSGGKCAWPTADRGVTNLFLAVSSNTNEVVSADYICIQ